ncbi:MAG: sensor histidine kinase [bacterium]
MGLNERERVPDVIPLEKELISRIEWFIKLRWLAGGGVTIASWTMHSLLYMPIPVVPLYCMGGLVLFYNVFFWIYAQRLRAAGLDSTPVFTRFANLQIVVDWLALIFIVHFSGGIESPVTFYFIFHVIFSTLLLSPRAAYLQTSLAVLLIVLLSILEYHQVIPHVNISGILAGNLYRNSLYLLGFLFFFVSALYISTYLASSITNKLRDRERELTTLKGDLEEAYHKLEKSDAAKSEFVVMVTHELRSPLSAIESILRLFIEGYAGQLLDKQKRLLQGIEYRARFLLTLVRDLLDLERLKAEKEKKKPTQVDLERLIEKVKESLKTEVRKKHLDLQLSFSQVPLFLLTDKEKMELLFSNLMSNAIKYTPHHGKILLKVIMENSKVKIEISDTGIGIPEEDLGKIFEEFYRAENAKKVEREGTGLGLPIVKRIVEAYGGKVKVKSQVGKGTTFGFDLTTEEGTSNYREGKF